MVESSKTPAAQSPDAAPASQGKASGSGNAPVWAPTEGAKAKAKNFRIIALVLWGVAIALEAVAIFWLLRQSETVGEDGQLIRDVNTGLLTEQGASVVFPQWAFVTLLVFLVIIAALAITGSFLWKKSNRLDPASREDTLRFFVQNQLGAIISVIAFLPLIILVFMNKDMDGKQKGIAGVAAIVLALLATTLGADFKPASIEQYTADQSTVIQLLGQDRVVWVDGGSVYHVCEEVSDIQTGSDKRFGTTAEAIEAGKTRLTLKFESELKACGLNVPENAGQIASALKEIQSGSDVLLPAPVWANPADAPIEVVEAVNAE